MTKKIAFVYDAIYPYVKGGGEKRYYEIAKRLATQGFEIHLYGMKLWDGLDVIYKEGIYLHGICPAKPLYTKDGRRSIWQAIYFGINCLKLIKEDFDIVDCCGFPYFSLFACKLVCLFKGKKLNSTWHEVWGKDYWKEYLKFLWFFGYLVEKVAVLLPDRIIAVSEATSKKLKIVLNYKCSITVIPNGIDYDQIRNIKPSLTESDIIYAGRLLDFKNIDLLIKSVSILKEKYSNIKCLIIGDGPEKKRLEKIVKTLELSKNVIFSGFLKNHDEVYSLMKSSKVFVLPSTREGFGIVVIEANACGIPVITINHRDNTAKYLIEENKNGCICDLDEKDIAKRITNILKNGDDKKMKQNCIDFAEKYDWNKIINSFDGAYLK